MKILDAAQMRNIDRRTTERFAVPSIVLMENAAIAVIDAIHEHYPNADRVAIFCGTGQNGGDGLAVARHLENRGVVPVIFIIGDRDAIRGDARTNLEACTRLALPIYGIAHEGEIAEGMAHAADADLIVDAIFGTGLNRTPAGVAGEVIRAMAELRIPILSIDLPSGANASSGTPFDPCVRAEVTVTFAAPKVCHVFEPAASYCGEIIVADISIPDIAIDEEGVSLALTRPREIAPFFAPRLVAVGSLVRGDEARRTREPTATSRSSAARRGAAAPPCSPRAAPSAPARASSPSRPIRRRRRSFTVIRSSR